MPNCGEIFKCDSWSSRKTSKSLNADRPGQNREIEYRLPYTVEEHFRPVTSSSTRSLASFDQIMDYKTHKILDKPSDCSSYYKTMCYSGREDSDDAESHYSADSYFLPDRTAPHRRGTGLRGRQSSPRNRRRSECQLRQEEIRGEEMVLPSANPKSSKQQKRAQALSPCVLFWATKIDSLLSLVQAIVSFLLGGFMRQPKSTKNERARNSDIRMKKNNEVVKFSQTSFDERSDPEIAESEVFQQSSYPQTESIEPDVPVCQHDSQQMHRKNTVPTVMLMSLDSKRPRNRRPPLGRLQRYGDKHDPIGPEQDCCSEASLDDDIISLVNCYSMPLASSSTCSNLQPIKENHGRATNSRAEEYMRRGTASSFPRARALPSMFPTGRETKQNSLVSTRHDSTFFLQK